MEDGVCDEEFMLCTCLEKEKSIAVAISRPMLSNHAFPGGGITANPSVEVTKNDELVGIRDRSNDSIQVFVKLVLSLSIIN